MINMHLVALKQVIGLGLQIKIFTNHFDFHFKAILFNTVSNKYLIDLIFLVSWTLLAVFFLHDMGINKIKII